MNGGRKFNYWKFHPKIDVVCACVCVCIETMTIMCVCVWKNNQIFTSWIFGVWLCVDYQKFVLSCFFLSWCVNCTIRISTLLMNMNICVRLYVWHNVCVVSFCFRVKRTRFEYKRQPCVYQKLFWIKIGCVSNWIGEMSRYVRTRWTRPSLNTVRSDLNGILTHTHTHSASA